MASLHVLVVDDSPINRDVAQALLELRGHRVSVAKDGAQAIGMSKQNDYDVILMDIQMDKIDGLDATKAIREYEEIKGESTIIIGATASGEEEDRMRALEAGMNDCIYKPLRAEGLFDAISNSLGERAVKNVTQEVVSGKSSRGLSDHALNGVIDMDEALSCCDGNIQIFKSVAQAFIDDAPKTRDRLAGLIESPDIEELGRCAHRIKGGSSVIGAMPVFRAAKELVDYCRSPVPTADVANELASELLHELKRAHEAVQYLLAQDD